MSDILGHGFSRIPVHAADGDGGAHCVRGYLLVKRLIVIDPTHERRISGLHLRQPVVVGPDTSLLELLREFQRGHSHMALVVEHPVGVRAAIRAALKDDPAHPRVRYPDGTEVLVSRARAEFAACAATRVLAHATRARECRRGWSPSRTC